MPILLNLRHTFVQRLKHYGFDPQGELIVENCLNFYSFYFFALYSGSGFLDYFISAFADFLELVCVVCVGTSDSEFSFNSTDTVI